MGFSCLGWKFLGLLWFDCFDLIFRLFGWVCLFVTSGVCFLGVFVWFEFLVGLVRCLGWYKAEIWL